MDFTLLFLVFGFIVAIATSINILREKFSENPRVNKWDPPNPKRRSAVRNFVLLALASLCTLSAGIYSSWKSSISANNEKIANDSLINIQRQLIELSLNQRDTALRILSLSQRLNLAQKAIQEEQQKIIDFQNFSFDQLSGGDNKPILTLSSGYQFQNQLRDSAMFYDLHLHNVGKTFLRDVDLTIIDRYKGFSYINHEIQKEYIQDSSNFLKNYHLKNYIDREGNPTNAITDISFRSIGPAVNGKNIYHNREQYGKADIDLVVKVSWSNGYHTAKFSGKFYNGVIRFLFINYEKDGKPIDNLEEYFKGAKFSAPKSFVNCGRIKFKGLEYEVIWDKDSKNTIIRQPNSIYLFYYETKANSTEEARRGILGELTTIFGGE